jgi:putative transposase
MRRYLVSLGYGAGNKRVRRLMRLMGLMAVYQKPKTSAPNTEHKRYPYLLRGLTIDRSNQVWCADDRGGPHCLDRF